MQSIDHFINRACTKCSITNPSISQFWLAQVQKNAPRPGVITHTREEQQKHIRKKVNAISSLFVHARQRRRKLRLRQNAERNIWRRLIERHRHRLESATVCVCGPGLMCALNRERASPRARHLRPMSAQATRM